jgi:hypothetical protein
MRLVEVTWRHRNDFHWKGECESCGHITHYGDGYADHFYCTKVIPDRHCEKCGFNSLGHKEDPDEHLD